MLRYLMFFLVLVVCAVTRPTGKSFKNYETDSIIDFLLNGDLTEDEFLMDSIVDPDAIPIIFKDGVWKYGSCGSLLNTKPIYSEVYDVEKDESVTGPIVVQVELIADNMRCVMIDAESTSQVVKVAGSIKTSSVTFSVSNSYQFIVHVY